MLVGIVMGSESDWETMKGAAETLAQLQIPYEAKVVSAPVASPTSTPRRTTSGRTRASSTSATRT